MTQEEKSNLIPQERYANAYIETWTDIDGVKHEDFRLGDLYEKIKKIYQITMKYHMQEQFIWE